MKGVMIQGTASDVGKSLIVTALCRMFANEGIKVAPFKSQNMSNNSYVTDDGKEIGRAQGIQAEAAKIAASVWMNPILLKPRSHQHSEVVYLGKAAESLSGREYRERFYDKGLEVIRESLSHLEEEFNLLIIEGAGSPVEINLNDREIVNMRVAEIADVPVILVSDIDRGGVFASIVGTLELLTPEERKRVAGLIINKFRGDLTLFADGVNWLEEKTGIPVLGVLPYMENHMIDGEDSLSISEQFRGNKSGGLDIAVIQLPFISNYSDLEPFLYEEDVSLRWVKEPSEFGEPDAVIIPGTKSTMNDLSVLKAKRLDELLQNHAARGGFIIGICGGYQMLGEEMIDEAGLDTGIAGNRVKALGLIPAATFFMDEKETVRTTAALHKDTALLSAGSLEGYEIHLGRTILKRRGCSFLEKSDGQSDGYYGENGKIIGTYLHHLFHNDEWRNQWLNLVRQEKGFSLKETVRIRDFKDRRFDELARQMKEHLNWDLLQNIIDQWSICK